MSMLTALPTPWLPSGAFRFLLGIGEGCNWLGASKTVAESFSARERGVAVAIFDSGSSVGGAIASLTVPWVAILLGWRYAFVLSGLLGFLWLILWLAIYHPIDQHPRLTAEERALIVGGRDTPTVSAQKGLARWLDLLKQPNVWGNSSRPLPYRSHLVVLRVLAAANLRDAGVHLKQIAAFGGFPLLRRIWKFCGRLRLRLFDQARHGRGARAEVGLRHQFFAASAGIPRRPDSQPLCGNLPDQPCRVGVCKLGNHQKECRGVGEFIHKPTHQQGEDNSRQAGTKSAQSGHRTDTSWGNRSEGKVETQSANRVRYLFATSTYWRDMNGRRWHN